MLAAHFILGLLATFCAGTLFHPHCDRVCDMTFDPVCTENSQTKFNQCFLEDEDCRRNTTTNFTLGSCPGENLPLQPDLMHCARKCSTTRDFVCGSDGSLYPNRCQFDHMKCIKERQNQTITLVPCADSEGFNASFQTTTIL